MCGITITSCSKRLNLNTRIKPKDIKYMIDNLSAVRDEVVEAIEGHDKQLNEGYSHFNKPMKKRYVAMLDKWIQQCKEHTTSKRKPRKVKVKTPEQLTKNVKYMESCSDFSSSDDCIFV